ncbi:MAG: thioredoxin domain-containing protein [Polyangiaceae bacterium]|nr:thioredoxin domain-containing protein [Polyangiaceae bacterium]
MKALHGIFVYRVAALLGLMMSVVLFIALLSPEQSFCSASSGCGAVSASRYSAIPLGAFEIPLPLLGMFAFAALFGLSMAELSPRWQKKFRLLSMLLGGVGLLLLSLQALVIGSYCPFCVVVDLSLVILAAAAFFLDDLRAAEVQQLEAERDSLVDLRELGAEGRRSSRVWAEDSRLYEAPTPIVRGLESHFRLRRKAWFLLALWCLVAPVLVTELSATPAVPGEIRALYEPGKINIVEFFDFQCPHCRDLGPRLDDLVQEQGPTVRLDRRYVPLPSHARARVASILALCAAEQGKEDELVERIFTAKSLDDDTLLGLVRDLELNGPKLAECEASGRPEEELKSNIELIRKIGFQLPTVFIGGTKLVGALEDGAYRQAMIDASEGEDLQGVPSWLLWLTTAVIALGLIYWGSKQTQAPNYS